MANLKFSFEHVKFQVPIRNPNGYNENTLLIKQQY